MTEFQRYALANPLARANDVSNAQRYRRLDMPWSIILTVNK
jgi:hypothetical protein